MTDPQDAGSPETSTSLAIIEPPALATPTNTYIMPALIADLGDQAGWRYMEFFAANIRNPHTRRAYARACSRFFAWCERRGLTLAAIRPHDVATYYRATPDGGLGAVGQAAARRGADAVRLARRRPDRPDEPGGGGAWAETRRKDRFPAGTRERRVAQAARFYSSNDAPRSSTGTGQSGDRCV